MPVKKDQDRADEGRVANVNPNALGGADRPAASPDDRHAAATPEPSDTPKQASARRVKGARFLGGVWYAADGTPLTDAEAQQAHRAMDAASAEARARVLRGEG